MYFEASLWTPLTCSLDCSLPCRSASSPLFARSRRVGWQRFCPDHACFCEGKKATFLRASVLDATSISRRNCGACLFSRSSFPLAVPHARSDAPTTRVAFKQQLFFQHVQQVHTAIRRVPRIHTLPYTSPSTH